METRKTNSMVNVKYCSSDQCLRGTEYYCHNCQKDLCRQCQQEHETNLDTKHHKMILYKNKVNNLSTVKGRCKKHSGCVYKKFCESCKIPICSKCCKGKRHRKHKKVGLLKVYENKREQHDGNINEIRSETIYTTQVLLSELKTDAKTCCKDIPDIKSSIDAKSRKLKNVMDVLLRDGSYYENYIQQGLSQIRKIKRYIGMIQIYEDIHEQSDRSPIRFLQFVKTVRAPRIKDTPRLALYRLLPLTQDISTDELMGHLTEIKVLEGDKRHIENKKLLKLMDSLCFYDAFTIEGVAVCHHISCVTPDRIWVSDDNNIILTDTRTGETLHCIKNEHGIIFFGIHTIDSQSDLIYLEKGGIISKLGKDMKTKTRCTYIHKQCPGWCPVCVYCSPSSGDLLLGMMSIYKHKAKVVRYNKNEQRIQIIQHDNAGQEMYSFPKYITENNNGDVVVSDEGRGVVVTDREGRHRFSYTGCPSGSRIDPTGICTDGLSNILVCDFKSSTVHFINKDGQLILKRTGLSFDKLGNTVSTTPICLSYDFDTHQIWVGSKSENKENTVSLFRYIKRHSDLTDKIELFDANDATPSQDLA